MGEIQIPLTVLELFKFLGTPVFIGFLVSFLLERVPWFQQLNSDAKALVALLLAIVLPIVSYALLNYVPASFVEAVQPWYAAAITGIIGFIGSQVWHKLFKPETYIEFTSGQEEPPTGSTDARGSSVEFTPSEDIEGRVKHIGFYH